MEAVKAAPTPAEATVEEVKPVVADAQEEAAPEGESVVNLPKQKMTEVNNETTQDVAVRSEAEEVPVRENVVEAAEEKAAVKTGTEETAEVNFTEAAKANAAAAENADLTEGDKSFGVDNNGYAGMRKPLFSRFNPRGPMVFNRNGFPRKNADLRVALSELQKATEPKPQDSDGKPESVNDEGKKTELEDAELKPEGNKES